MPACILATACAAVNPLLLWAVRGCARLSRGAASATRRPAQPRRPPRQAAAPLAITRRPTADTSPPHKSLRDAGERAAGKALAPRQPPCPARARAARPWRADRAHAPVPTQVTRTRAAPVPRPRTQRGTPGPRGARRWDSTCPSRPPKRWRRGGGAGRRGRRSGVLRPRQAAAPPCPRGLCRGLVAPALAPEAGGRSSGRLDLVRGAAGH